MRVIGISGSPRKGNTEWMVDRVLAAARNGGAETELVLLRALDIRLCRGCLVCEADRGPNPGKCVIRDDMEPLLHKMLAADAIVFGTPVYFYLLSGWLKNFMDRTLPIWPLLHGKRAAGVAVAEDTIGRTLENVHTYTDLCRMTWVGEVSALATKPGEIASDEIVAVALDELGRRLVEALEGSWPKTHHGATRRRNNGDAD
ncbi:MAG: flavodoxin family protein [Dehalococcoidia bacterium]|nr:flavodoxin family protein [Dehalococcoidia bacterium]